MTNKTFFIGILVLAILISPFICSLTGYLNFSESLEIFMFLVLLSAFITMGRSFFLSFEAVDDEVRFIVNQKTIDRSEQISGLALTGIILFVIAFSMMAAIK